MNIKLTTKNMAYMAMFAAMQIVLEYCTKIYEMPIGIVITGALKTICHLISGWYAFQTPLKANLVYNLPYNIATIIACFILFVLLYPRLKNAVHL